MIQEITILSGKGGTGKTSVSAALAALAEKTVFTDCDVDAADLHLLLNPKINEENAFDSGSKAVIDPDKCTACGICMDNCRFDAIHHTPAGKYAVDPYKCEGCKLCHRLCPSGAIKMHTNFNNFWYVSETRFGPMVHAYMGPGEENSGKLVTIVRNKAKEIAREKNFDIIINDGPPGIGCPVIASLTGVQKVLLVVEASKTGIHDIERISGLTQKFGIETFALINKQDMNLEMTKNAEELLLSMGIPLLGKLNFDDRFVKAMIKGETIVEFAPDSEITNTLRQIWEKLKITKNTGSN